MAKGFLQSNFRVSVSLEGNNMGVFDKQSGGAVSADVQSYPPGGMAPPVVLAAPANKIDVLTITKLYTTDDHDNIDTWLSAVGKGTCVVREQPLDQNRAAYGPPVVWTGILTSVLPPENDSTSNTPGMLTITITPGGTVTS